MQDQFQPRGSDVKPTTRHAAMTLPKAHDVLAPDGSEVRVLLRLPGGSMAHFRLPAGQVSRAVRHRTVEEIWYILSGEGQMWLSDSTTDEVLELRSGLCVTIPLGVAFQFRASADAAVEAVAVTMPPWPGEQEAESAKGPWVATE